MSDIITIQCTCPNCNATFVMQHPDTFKYDFCIACGYEFSNHIITQLKAGLSNIKRAFDEIEKLSEKERMNIFVSCSNFGN